MFVVYVLYSEKFNKHYTGYTSNLEERLKSHFELDKKSYTSKYRPWELIYTKEFESKQDAINHEKWLKSGVGRSYIKNLKH